MTTRGKHRFVWLVAAALCMQTAAAAWVNPYEDVPEESWVYPYISHLNQQHILPDRAIFAGTTPVSRVEFVETLYAAHGSLHSTKPKPLSKPLPFTDMTTDNPAYPAIAWAYQNDITRGANETTFAPDVKITREAACTMLVRFARTEGMQLAKTAEASQFVDSLDIRQFARTPVLVCQMAGLINGYADGYFHPNRSINRNELAVMLCRLFESTILVTGTEPIPFEEGAYDELYATFKHAPVPAVYGLVPADQPVDLSYFTDAVFIGDSISLRLQYYCQETQALGNPTFLCANSLSASNALLPVSGSSFHPSYGGQKRLIEDSVAACQAKKVYIMLGMNNIGAGVDLACADMVTLIDRIQAKSPDAFILVQSVTPIAAGSQALSAGLNNATIESFNQKMESLCKEHSWYFVDVGRAFRNKDGYLDTAYCSDISAMGLHFTTEAAAVWVEYLKTHVPLSILWPCE